MNFRFEDLHAQTRFLMISEIKSDICKEKLYISPVLNEIGRLLYPQLLLLAVKEGDEASLAKSLKFNNCVSLKKVRPTDSGLVLSRLPQNTHKLLAESEFNRFYLRALAIQAIEAGKLLKIYCAKSKCSMQREKAVIGNTLNPRLVLEQLRNTATVSNAFGIADKINTSLSARIA